MISISIIPLPFPFRLERFTEANLDQPAQELRKQYQIISELRAEIKSLQADNLKLYEKVRYMQSYRQEAGSRPPVSQLDPLPAPPGQDDMSTYRTRYEEAMNPFEAFRGRVRGSCICFRIPLCFAPGIQNRCEPVVPPSQNI